MRRASLEKTAARFLTRPGVRAVAAPAYDALIRTQLAVQARLDALAPREPHAEDCTIVVKTHERPEVIARLVRSAHRRLTSPRILVADDSRTPSEPEGARTMRLPYDVGLSAGRNRALEAVDTPYFLLADDDFIFWRGTRITQTLETLRRHPEIDIAGGRVIDLPLHRCVDVAHRRALGATGAPVDGEIGGLPRREVVRNFFVARTERVRAVGWDEQLKLVEHADFFGRALGRLEVVFDARLSILHAKTPFDREYMARRTDVERYQALLRLKWPGRSKSGR